MTDQQVSGIAEQDYQTWRHHPVTKVFIEYLRDYRADLIEAAAAQWLDGNLQIATADELRGRALAIGDIAELPFAAMIAFYQAINQKREDQEDDAKS